MRLGTRHPRALLLPTLPPPTCSFALNSKDQAEAYLELYCDRADMPMQVVQSVESIVAASELARKRNVNDEFLKNWIDVVDYQ